MLLEMKAIKWGEQGMLLEMKAIKTMALSNETKRRRHSAKTDGCRRAAGQRAGRRLERFTIADDVRSPLTEM
jgi:hypothetical protein